MGQRCRVVGRLAVSRRVGEQVALNIISTVDPALGPAMAPTPSGVVAATPTDPPSAGVDAYEPTPTMRVGLFLANRVLWITSGVIAAFFVYLFVMEYEVASNIQDAYKTISMPNRSGAEFEALSRLEKAIADLAKAEKDTSFQPPVGDSKNIEDVLGLVSQMPSVSSAQKNQLKDCWPFPSDGSRAPKLAACARVLKDVHAVAAEALINASVIHAATERVTKINDHRQGLHSFWIQAVQVILVNVLLPLLTALLGYIFGSQQRANG